MNLIIGTLERKILLVFFILAIVYWIVFALVSGYQPHPLGIYTQLALIVIPLTGGIFGLGKVKAWGGIKSAMGRVVLTLSIEMITWGTGILIWTYYLFKGIAIPYPSPADYVFVWSLPLWTYGLWQLAKVVGVAARLRTLKGKIYFALITIITAAISYYMLVMIARGSLINPQASSSQLFFDFVYTFGLLLNVIMVAVILTLAKKYLGGRYKQPILFLLLGLTTHFVAIFFFTYTTTHQTYFSGNIADLLFTFAIYLESLGIINLDTKLSANV